MIKDISIIGGDLRIIKLANMLNKDGYKIYTYGLEKAKDLDEEIIKCESLNELVNSTNTLIGSIPFSKDGEYINAIFTENRITIEDLINQVENKVIIAGNISEKIIKKFENKKNKVIDILNKEELAIMNVIPTAEGALQIAMEETDFTINGSKTLILGFGRVGKILAKTLNGIGAKVYCEARKKSDIAWIKAYGYYPIELSNLEEKIESYDIIFNTVPYLILDEKKLKRIKKDCLIIDLASKPGGVDREKAKQLGIKYIWALALPGKVAPKDSARYIKETLYNIFEEMEK